MEIPYEKSLDSPSRQLLWELRQLSVDRDECFNTRLERQTQALEKDHQEALAAAAAEHERVRQNAEIARERFQLEKDLERKRKEEEDQNELDRRRREKANLDLEQRRKEIERARKIELDLKKAADDRKASEDAEEVRKAKQKEDDDAAEAQRKAAKAIAEQKARAESLPVGGVLNKPTQAPPSNPSPIPQQSKQPSTESSLKAPSSSKQGSATAEKENIHKRYLEIHQRLKHLRKFTIEKSKQNPALKSKVGDMRREIRKSLGQLTTNTKENQAVIQKILAVFRAACKFSEPTIDIRPFLLPKPGETLPRNGDGPALLLYLVNIFTKAVISQFIDEAGVKPEAADPIGVVAVTILARPDFQWQSRPLTDILIAKYHAVCPVLFGIYGNEKTNLGKQRLGWSREEPGGAFVSQQRHNERMTGLGAGFAALTLRNFSKSQYKNPYPNSNYWQAMAGIVNVPAQEITPTHFVVLKAMTENYEEKFLRMFGSAALVALKKALVDFPNQEAVQKSVAASAISALAEIIKREKRLTLTT